MELDSSRTGWTQFDRSDVVQARSIHGERTIFAPHKTLKLYPMDPHHQAKLMKNCEELHEMAEK